MRRGTTPTNIFETDTDLTEAEAIYITYQQGGVILFEKTIEDIEVNPTDIRIHLTQEETLMFQSSKKVYMQIRAKFGDDSAIASQIMTASVDDILKGGVI